jgi:hypothetical protein
MSNSRADNEAPQETREVKRVFECPSKPRTLSSWTLASPRGLKGTYKTSFVVGKRKEKKEGGNPAFICVSRTCGGAHTCDGICTCGGVGSVDNHPK